MRITPARALALAPSNVNEARGSLADALGPLSIRHGQSQLGELMERLPYPSPTSSAVSRRMRRNPRRDTRPEMAVRSTLHARGLRFRKDLPLRLPGRVVRPDVAFTKARVALFVDGCFWHRCPLHGNQPQTNCDYWGPKLDRNVARDRLVDRALEEAGWLVVRAWEHEPPNEVADRVASMLAGRSDG